MHYRLRTLLIAVTNGPTQAFTVMLIVAALGFWLGYFYCAYLMINGRKPGVSAFGRELLGSPFNICFRPTLLTDDGLRARLWFFVCAIGFPVCVLLLLAIHGAFTAS